MTAKLNHTIVYSRDKRASAKFLSEILGCPAPVPFGPFLGVQTGNEVTLDFMNADEKISPQHYAFLISEAEFDDLCAHSSAKLPLLGRSRATTAGEINTAMAGRGLYFEDSSGHLLEILRVRTAAGASGGAPVDFRSAEDWQQRSSYENVIAGKA
jgi:hypothetical protein